MAAFTTKANILKVNDGYLKDIERRSNNLHSI